MVVVTTGTCLVKHFSSCYFLPEVEVAGQPVIMHNNTYRGGENMEIVRKQLYITKLQNQALQEIAMELNITESELVQAGD